MFISKTLVIKLKLAFGRKDRDKHREFSRDLYEHGVIEDDTIKELKLSKEKDDFER